METEKYIWPNYSDLTRPHPKSWFSKGHPLVPGKTRLVKYYNFARYLFFMVNSCKYTIPCMDSMGLVKYVFLKDPLVCPIRIRDFIDPIV